MQISVRNLDWKSGETLAATCILYNLLSLKVWTKGLLDKDPVLKMRIEDITILEETAEKNRQKNLNWKVLDMEK